MSQETPEFVFTHKWNRETFSYSKPDEAQVTHMCFTFDFNMKDRSIMASNVLSIEKKHPDVEYVCLDVFDLNIISLRLCGDLSRHMEYYLTPSDPIYGQGLIVKLPQMDKCRLMIKYMIGSPTLGIRWVPRLDGLYFIYSSHFYSLARSVIPCQDNPQIKGTYSGEIIVPPPYHVLMAGILVEQKIIHQDRAFRFEQNLPVCTYHIAFVIGQLKYTDVSRITRVWYEPNTIMDETFWEDLHRIPEVLKTIEKIQGSYVWGICDIMVMDEPISRTYPCLNWLHRTAGYDSILNMLARNWFGSMVSCHTWEHYWLHEAYAKFMERKLLEKFVFKDDIDQVWQEGLDNLNRNLKAKKSLGCIRYSPYDSNSLDSSILLSTDMCESSYRSPFHIGQTDTKLLLDLTNFNPNITINEARPIHSEKGAILFRTLEDICGVIEFEQFLKYIIQKYKYDTITSQQFNDDLKKYFFNMKLFAFDMNTWLTQPGKVPVEPQYIDPDKETIKLMAALISLNKEDLPLTKIDMKQLSLNQLKYLFKLLLDRNLTCSTIEKLIDLINIDDYKDLEFQKLWLNLCVKNRYYVEKHKANMLKKTRRLSRKKQGNSVKKDKATKSKKKQGDSVKKDKATKSKKKQGDSVKKDKATKSKKKQGDSVKKDKATKSKKKQGDSVKKDKATESKKEKGDSVKKDKATKSKKNQGDSVKKDKATESKKKQGDSVKKDKATESKKKQGDSGSVTPYVRGYYSIVDPPQQKVSMLQHLFTVVNVVYSLTSNPSSL
ncbi:hypothetical protein WDU94_006393 [Cyamophila willieti]